MTILITPCFFFKDQQNQSLAQKWHIRLIGLSKILKVSLLQKICLLYFTVDDSSIKSRSYFRMQI